MRHHGLAALLVLASPLGAQKVTKAVASPNAASPNPSSPNAASPTGGAFVVRLGSDTLAVERYTRSGRRVEGDVVNRLQAVRVTHYVADLDASGRPTRVQYASRAPDGTPLPNAAKSVTLTFRGDSAWSEVVTAADTIVRGRAAVAPGTVASIANSYAMYELALMQLRAARSAVGAITLWGPGAPSATAYKVSLAGDAATMDYFGDPVAITTDAAGHILAVDGTRSTNKVVVERVTTADVPALATAFGRRGPLAAPSPRDTVRAAAGGAQLWIDYSRPSVRGRTVWGGLLVPYGAIWRTGANGATQLVTDRDLVIGGTPVPAGKYTLWTWAAPEGYQLVVNKQTGQWGTDYKADEDLARVPLTVAPLAQPVEQFTFVIEPVAAGGTIRMMWGDKQLSVPFTVKP